MKKTEINLSTVATPDSFNIINTLVDHFGIIHRYQTIDNDITLANARLDKANATINVLEKKQTQSTVSMFETDKFSEDDALKLNKAYENRITVLTRIETLETEKTEVYNMIEKWADKDGNTFNDCETAVTYYIDIINSLHMVDRRTIEILSSLTWNVRLNMPQTVETALKRYYNYMVSHSVTDKANSETQDMKQLVKDINSALQSFVNTYSIIYNEERTSEGLFIPQHLNINMTETRLFISTYFQGTKIDKSGNTTAKYMSKTAVCSELNKLMLCKFQGLKYGQEYKFDKDGNRVEK